MSDTFHNYEWGMHKHEKNDVSHINGSCESAMDYLRMNYIIQLRRLVAQLHTIVIHDVIRLYVM